MNRTAHVLKGGYMKRLVLTCLTAYALAGTAASWASPPVSTPVENPDDPWENVNHGIFDFNLCFDRNVAKPVASAYHVLPAFVRHSVGNVITNLSEPLNTIHGVLQLNPKVAFTSLWRFILNTTVGFAGIRDFAGEQGLHNMDQNLGKTLGRWGVGAGPYVVLPLLGPSSVRDTTGKVGDWFLSPVGWVTTTWEDVGLTAADSVNTRDSKSGTINYIYYQSINPYVAARSAYRQHEAFELTKDSSKGEQ